MEIFSILVLAFVTAFLVTYYVMPSIIEIARVKGLTDEPGERRSHTQSTPSLGGVGIFAGVLFSVVAWIPHRDFEDIRYVLCACVVMFLVGAKDDILPSRPWKKMLGQLFAAAILISAADLHIPSLFGIGGVGALPPWAAVALTAFTIIVIINAFNLIDGVNGLTGTISVVSASALGGWFYLVGRPEYTVLAVALVGSTLAFLRYNWTPARIFMGDTGSLLLGLLMSVLTIEFIELHHDRLTLPRESPYFFPAAPAAAIGLLIVPLFDTLRVFVTRAARGRSPLRPDRNHIHHLLVDLGLSHVQTTLVLGGVAVAFIALAVMLQDMGNLSLLLTMLALAALGSFALTAQVRRRERLLAERERLRIAGRTAGRPAEAVGS